MLWAGSQWIVDSIQFNFDFLYVQLVLILLLTRRMAFSFGWNLKFWVISFAIFACRCIFWFACFLHLLGLWLLLLLGGCLHRKRLLSWLLCKMMLHTIMLASVRAWKILHCTDLAFYEGRCLSLDILVMVLVTVWRLLAHLLTLTEAYLWLLHICKIRNLGRVLALHFYYATQ